jgi:hypothetical protein
MADYVLNDFLKRKGMIKEEPAKVTGKKQEPPKIIIETNTIKDIIENKPNNKKVIEFLKEKMQAYEQEFLD